MQKLNGWELNRLRKAAETLQKFGVFIPKRLLNPVKPVKLKQHSIQQIETLLDVSALGRVVIVKSKHKSGVKIFTWEGHQKTITGGVAHLAHARAVQAEKRNARKMTQMKSLAGPASVSVPAVQSSSIS